MTPFPAARPEGPRAMRRHACRQEHLTGSRSAGPSGLATAAITVAAEQALMIRS